MSARIRMIVDFRKRKGGVMPPYTSMDLKWKKPSYFMFLCVFIEVNSPGPVKWTRL